MGGYQGWAVSLAWAMGMMLSPEALVLQGNVAGSNGFAFILPLAVAIGLYGATTRGPGFIKRASSKTFNEIEVLLEVYGRYGAALLLHMARPVVAVCLATATLVRSGFVFNETFVYWFPNFAFAGLLLAALLAINLMGPRLAAAAQVTFTAVSLTGLSALLVVALFSLNEPRAAFGGRGTGVATGGLFLVFPAFVGFDMLRYTVRRPDNQLLPRMMRYGLLAGGVLFLFWNMIALLFVPASRLAETQIPHILIAKAIAGQGGRIVIGVASIAGTCAAVNLLFQSVARMMMQMARQGLLPSIENRTEDRPVVPLLAMAVLTGVLMAMGFAGSENLDIAIRAGLILWVLLYGLTQWAYARHCSLAGKSSGDAMIRHLFLFAMMIIPAVMLVVQFPHRLTLLKAMSIILLISATLALSSLSYTKSRNRS